METKKIDKINPSKLKISIIIPSYNTQELLSQCLKSLDSNSEIIVIDNGSTDGSVNMLRKLQSQNPKIKTIFNQKNKGFGGANNQGIKIATGDYLLFLNSDTLVKNQAPFKMAQFLKENPKAGMIGCRLLNKDGSWQPSAGYFPSLGITFIMLFAEHWLGDLVRSSFPKEKEVDWVMGAAMMIKKEVIAKAGLMDEGIFMYMDEVEWAYRIKKAGFKIVFYPGAEITHLFGASSKTGRQDPILNIYRGLLYFYKKHYSPSQLVILKIMLKLKAVGALILGFLTNNRYLKQTYVQALEITRS
jgi:GT2 family glycosyltransferase